MRDPLVSACLIVRDEESRLRSCLDAIQPFVDEVVVCDTGSTDATVAIATSAGAVVIKHEWQRDFAAARNHALSAATMGWVLSVDADELASGVAPWLPVLLQAARDELDGLWVQIDNSSCPDATAPAVHRELRLFQRTACRWSGRVHEMVISRDGGPLRTANLPPETLQFVHHGYDDRPSATAKAIRNADLAAQQLPEHRRSAADRTVIARSALDLGRSYIGAGRPDLAGEPLTIAADLGDADTQRWARNFQARYNTTAPVGGPGPKS